MNQLNQINYTHVLIIGNGFDLDQELKTSYIDFLESAEFKNLLDKNNYFIKYLNTKNKIERWIDVEEEFKTYSRKDTATEKIDPINYKKEKIKLTRSLQDYLQRVTHDYEININKESFELIKDIVNEDYLIFNFNYTDTVKKMLINLGEAESEVADRLVNVHGKITHDEIIFGVEDSSVESKYSFLYKGYNTNYHLNFGLHKLKERLIQSYKLYFFGHSLGLSDRMYFKDFFEKKINIQINHIPEIFLYHREGREDILKNKISDMIGGQFTKLMVNYIKVDYSPCRLNIKRIPNLN